MKQKKTSGISSQKMKARIIIPIISMLLIAVILAGLYLRFSWNRYHQMAESEALQMAQSVESLLHAEHIETLIFDDSTQAISDASLVEQSLVRLVEATDSIYYAYILKQQHGNIVVIADSSAADSGTFSPMIRSCEETSEINRLIFETGRSMVTESISAPCGDWIRTLVPIFGTENNNVIAALGLSYSASEWQTNLRTKMIPDIAVVTCLAVIILVLANLFRKNLEFKEAEKSRQESECSKEVFFSHLPGMAYRCKYDQNWTMDYVSEGCYALTGYPAGGLIANRELSYNEIILPEYRSIVQSEWERVLVKHERYHGEYEIITKTGERKWVMELGQGIYNAEGNVEALEGLVLDISDRKKKEHQIAYLREHDFLTGLFNRNYLEQEKKRLDQSEYLPLSILICDIDGLRVINDTYGHEEGDQLIIKTAKLIQGCLHNDYVLGHTGGGEFVLLLPYTDSHKAHQVKIDIENTIANYNRAQKDALYAISVSIGHSTKDTVEQPIQDITKAAEEYLNRRKLLNQNSSHSAIVSSIMATLYAKSQETEKHGQRLGMICQIIGEQLGLTPNELGDLQLLSKLHDIGKIGIDDRILNKPGKLSEEEWQLMKQHPEIGRKIAMSTPQLEHIAEYILCHHERWDGAGYPMGLKGQEIPVLSRILSIADAFDAMTEDRVYRKAMTYEAAIREIERNAGTQFDPEITRLFVAQMATYHTV
ncbi:diguanylate cyclase [Lacrimispora amygdalina]|uniref:Diguanylate cyclase n=2 Tax=Lacrimispora TaxID=2719231 RepID=A0ABX1VXM5_9FIRM|nr:MULTISPECIES: HD domain-containing phosphohydrolase [Clostridia]NNJ33194.1 diguanylate cyclase [Lacrimispora defluvii]RFZ80134.1 diguanylate cyclase [Clostridium indicum]